MRVDKVNSVLIQKQRQMKVATFNFQVDEMDGEDSQQEFEDQLNAKIVARMQDLHTPRDEGTDPFGDTGFVPVKSKAGKAAKKYDIHDPDSHSLENIVAEDNHYQHSLSQDEQMSGGSPEPFPPGRSSRSSARRKSEYQQSPWMQDKFTGDVFVVFNSRRKVHKITYSQNTLLSDIRFQCARVSSWISPEKNLYPSLQDFQECDEPEGVLWEMYNTKPKPSWIKRTVSVYIWSLLLICGQAVAMYVVKQRIEGVEDQIRRGTSGGFHAIQLPFALAKTLVIIIFNKIQDQVLQLTITKFGEYATLERRMSRLTLDLIVVKVITSCFLTLAVFSIDNREQYNIIAYLVINEDFILTASFTCFFQAFVLPLIQVSSLGKWR
jgi:hypothetical protein